MADIKVTYPEVIQDQPFPSEETANYSVSNNKSVSEPGKISNQNFPVKKIAVELIGQALNTQSKKILQEFELMETGGVRAGKYEPGVSGEVALTPAGLTGKNKSGLYTFTIDSETGDAIFRGILQAGTFIGADGQVQIDEVDGHARMLFFEGDKVAILLGWGTV